MSITHAVDATIFHRDKKSLSSPPECANNRDARILWGCSALRSQGVEILLHFGKPKFTENL